MITYPFEYSEDLQLIVIIATIDGFDVKIALDIGASRTVIDLTEILIVGYRKSDIIGTEEFETGKGNITAENFLINNFEALGISRQNFTISSYDFLLNNVLSDIQGVLGLDFFEDTKFCIDMKKKVITIQ